METEWQEDITVIKKTQIWVYTGHLINKEMLENYHVQMDGTKAVGIDGVTKEEYRKKSGKIHKPL